ncbi:MAG TPA: crotonase/enoyl-CoA hydratase family protein [Mycobacterium sp.]|uniref:crotonase/enoyl-CoA hydratase family protein n=1 Tax=Rhodococcus erythropolis TaxID=1833 RepID=UPI0024B7BDEF|nr:crotonase/enoyl-CoA hydratase family protein [Rhodococcus erythropolis]MDJ0015506.1 crotonase/enoyl-CoA hydratase family protein [Rhodococcus erythropolis]
MANDAVLVERDGHVETWVLNRPEERNPISSEDMISALESCVAGANADPHVRVVILTGAGSSFSAGGNLKHMRDEVPPFGGPPHRSRDGYRFGIQRIPRAFAQLDVPVVAAVNGPAIGAGCDLALMCDLRIASEDAIFAESFVKLGLIPGDGGAWLLPRVVGPARAAEMTLTGDRIDARTALAWGLVNDIVAPENLLPAARRLADRIAVNPPVAVRMAKQLLRQSDQTSLTTLLELAASMQPLAHATADNKEAVAAMLERRDANFTGE